MYGIVLAGGSGTRFWPLSRSEYPKQLLKIFGDQTLIQVTVSRVSELIPSKHLYIVTNPKQAEQMKLQFPSEESLRPHFVSEPFGRDTAAAIGLAAITLKKKHKDGVMAVLSADHYIKKTDAFLDMLRLAEKVAGEGYLVTIGAKPSRPETAYGYIEQNEPLHNLPLAFSVARFIEKPERESAKVLFKKEGMFWNTGMFVWKISSILSEIEQHMPELFRSLEAIEAAIGTDQEESLCREIYEKLPATSIDYGILEKSDKIAVIPSDMGWEDVGSWTALDEVLPRNEDGNIQIGNVVNINSKNSTIYAGKRVIAAVGLENIVIADTPDATLVCTKESAQDVKKVVAFLKKANKEEHRIHQTVIRAWGSYTILEEGEGYKIKRIVVNPKSKLSLQSHRKRSEHWIVVSGVATVTCGESVYTIQVNQSTFVPKGVKHRLENTNETALQIIEVQNGDYLGEDDITRYEDDYGRV